MGRWCKDLKRISLISAKPRFCIGVGSGTDALRFTLIAAGVKPGCIVITVPNTFIATTEAVSQAGAQPDFVDIDPKTYAMDPGKLREYLEHKCRWNTKTRQVIHNATGKRVTAVVPVHLYGQMADMDPILDICAYYNLKVIEDALSGTGSGIFLTEE